MGWYLILLFVAWAGALYVHSQAHRERLRRLDLICKQLNTTNTLLATLLKTKD